MFNFKNGAMNVMIVKQLDKMIVKDPAGANKMVEQLLAQFRESDADTQKSALSTLEGLYDTAKKSKCQNVVRLIDRIKKEAGV